VYNRDSQGCPYQNKDVVPSEALEQALSSHGELCKHGEAWARRIGASDDPAKLKAFTELWWDLAPQFRSWEVPPDDGKKCIKCKQVFRLGFYKGTTWRDRCECNKGSKRLAEERKLMGQECYQKGLKERDMQQVVQRAPKKQAPASPRLEAVVPDVAIDDLELHVKDNGAVPVESAHAHTKKKKAKKKTNVDLAAQLFAGPPQARDRAGAEGVLEPTHVPPEAPWAVPWAAPALAAARHEDPLLPSRPPLPRSPLVGRARQNSWNPAEDPPLPSGPAPVAAAPPPAEPVPNAVYAPPAPPVEAPKKTGTVIWFSAHKNQGFLKPDDGGADVWMHGDGVRAGVHIKKDDRVSYREEVYGKANRVRAADVGKAARLAKPARRPASLRAPPPAFDAALVRALAESADAYAHRRPPPTANAADDELQRALQASADEFADEQRRNAYAAPVSPYAPAPAPYAPAPYSAPTPQYDPPYVPPEHQRHSLADLASRPQNGFAPSVEDDLAMALAASREAEAQDARRRRDLAAAEERLRAARLAAAPPPGPPPGMGGPPGLPPGLAGFPAAPTLSRDPLAAFLDGAGMGRYLSMFNAEEIRTLEDFRLLTAQDLYDIGLASHDAAVLHQRTAAHYLANGL